MDGGLAWAASLVGKNMGVVGGVGLPVHKFFGHHSAAEADEHRAGSMEGGVMAAFGALRASGLGLE
jgi:hypothetical protein